MSLHGPYDRDNIFARILRGEAPCAKVYEDEASFAFLDIFPQTRGHTLVIPKTETRTVLTFPPGAWGPYMAGVQRVAAAVERALKPDGVMLMQLNGAPAGQTVFHFHMHILPRWTDEQLKGHGKAGMAEPAALQTLAAQIAAAF
jgi:histidine triad (HIT) family protein